MSCKGNFVQDVKPITPVRLGAGEDKFQIKAVGQQQSGHRPMQIKLDNRQHGYIIMFTGGRVHSRNHTHEGRTRQKVQARVTQAAWRAKPACRISDGPAVSEWRLLRLRRSCAGQVRNASASQSGQSAGEPVCIGVRFFSPDVLPSGSGFRGKWAVGTPAAKARPSAGSQVDTRSHGVYHALAIQHAFDSPHRVSSGDQKTVQRDCSSAQHRACFGTTGKKTSVTKLVGAKDPQALISAYEELRQQALDDSSLGDLGMGLFLTQGMVAWMQACSWIPATVSKNSPSHPSTSAPLPQDLRGEIVTVLAAMALRQVSEVHP
jgi:hypothetical protein